MYSQSHAEDDEQDAEQSERDELRNQTSQSNVVADLCEGASGDLRAASGGLEEEGDDVARDKELGDEAGADEQAVLRAEVVCHSAEEGVGSGQESAWGQEKRIIRVHSAKKASWAGEQTYKD